MSCNKNEEFARRLDNCQPGTESVNAVLHDLSQYLSTMTFTEQITAFYKINQLEKDGTGADISKTTDGRDIFSVSFYGNSIYEKIGWHTERVIAKNEDPGKLGASEGIDFSPSIE